MCSTCFKYSVGCCLKEFLLLIFSDLPYKKHKFKKKKKKKEKRKKVDQNKNKKNLSHLEHSRWDNTAKGLSSDLAQSFFTADISINLLTLHPINISAL